MKLNKNFQFYFDQKAEGYLFFPYGNKFACFEVDGLSVPNLYKIAVSNSIITTIGFCLAFMELSPMAGLLTIAASNFALGSFLLSKYKAYGPVGTHILSLQRKDFPSMNYQNFFVFLGALALIVGSYELYNSAVEKNYLMAIFWLSFLAFFVYDILFSVCCKYKKFS